MSSNADEFARTTIRWLAVWDGLLVRLSDTESRPVRCLLLLDNRTFDGDIHRSEMCHERTHAPWQLLPYSMTSSARAISASGTSIRCDFAVLRLMTNSNFVG